MVRTFIQVMYIYERSICYSTKYHAYYFKKSFQSKVLHYIHFFSYSLINFLICCCSPRFAQIWCILDAVPSSWVGILGLKGMPSNKFQVSDFMPMTELTVLFHPGTFLHFLDLSLAAAILFCSFPSTLFSTPLSQPFIWNWLLNFRSQDSQS